MSEILDRIARAICPFKACPCPEICASCAEKAGRVVAVMDAADRRTDCLMEVCRSYERDLVVAIADAEALFTFKAASGVAAGIAERARIDRRR